MEESPDPTKDLAEVCGEICREVTDRIILYSLTTPGAGILCTSSRWDGGGCSRASEGRRCRSLWCTNTPTGRSPTSATAGAGVPVNRRRSSTDQGKYLGKFCLQVESLASFVFCIIDIVCQAGLPPSTTVVKVSSSRSTITWGSSSGPLTSTSPAPLRDLQTLSPYFLVLSNIIVISCNPWS